MLSVFLPGGTTTKKDGVGRRKRTPMTYHNPVLWAVLEFFFTPKWYFTETKLKLADY